MTCSPSRLTHTIALKSTLNCGAQVCRPLCAGFKTWMGPKAEQTSKERQTDPRGIANPLFVGHARLPRAHACRAKMSAMLTLQRRHSRKCPQKDKGPNYLKCRGHCPLRICGTQNGKRVRMSLKTRDVRRAARRLAEIEEEALGRPRKILGDAIESFQAQHAGRAPETQRKYKRVLNYLNTYCTQESIRLVDQISIETMDGYALWRNKENWTWIKEIEILRQFFEFCREREWIARNPAKALKRPCLLEANDVVPFTSAEIVSTIAACDQIGRSVR